MYLGSWPGCGRWRPRDGHTDSSPHLTSSEGWSARARESKGSDLHWFGHDGDQGRHGLRAQASILKGLHHAVLLKEAGGIFERQGNVENDLHCDKGVRTLNPSPENHSGILILILSEFAPIELTKARSLR